MNKELAPIAQTRRSNVLHLMKERKVSRQDLAKKLEMEYSLLSSYIGKNPSKGIGNSVAARLESVFELGQGALDISIIPKEASKSVEYKEPKILANTFLVCPLFLGTTHHGKRLNESLEHYVEEAYIRLSVVYDFQVDLTLVKAFKVSDDLIQNKFPKKSTVFVDSSVDTVKQSGYFLLAKDGRRTVCFVKVVEDGFELTCENNACGENNVVLKDLNHLTVLGRVFHTEFSVG